MMYRDVRTRVEGSIWVMRKNRTRPFLAPNRKRARPYAAGMAGYNQAVLKSSQRVPGSGQLLGKGLKGEILGPQRGWDGEDLHLGLQGRNDHPVQRENKYQEYNASHKKRNKFTPALFFHHITSSSLIVLI